MIPLRNTFSEIVAAFRDIEAKLRSLLIGNVDMKQRRIINAGTSVADFDYVTRLELLNAIAAIVIPELGQTFQAINVQTRAGFPKVVITPLGGLQVYNSSGTLIATFSATSSVAQLLVSDSILVQSATGYITGGTSSVDDDFYISLAGTPILKFTLSDVGGVRSFIFTVNLTNVMTIAETAVTVNGNVLMNGIDEWDACTATAANDMGPTGEGNLVTVSGNTQINGFYSSGYQNGTVRIFHFSGTPTVKHNTAPSAGYSKFMLQGSVDLVAAADTILMAILTSGGWQEISRKTA